MRIRLLTPVLLGLATGAIVMSCAPTDTRPDPPLAEVRPHVHEAHGDRRVDEYYWLRERKDPEVLEYLDAENEYAEAGLAHVADLRTTLFDEIVGRIREDDSTVPARGARTSFSTSSRR